MGKSIDIALPTNRVKAVISAMDDELSSNSACNPFMDAIGLICNSFLQKNNDTPGVIHLFVSHREYLYVFEVCCSHILSGHTTDLTNDEFGTVLKIRCI